MVVVLLAAPIGILWWAAQDGAGRLPEGTQIGGVDVGGLDRETAVERLRSRLEAPLERGVKVTVDSSEVRRIGPKRAGLHLGLERAVDKAIDYGANGNFILRGWRELTGAELASDERVRVRVDRGAIESFVDRIAADVAVPAEEAELEISLESVTVTEPSPGEALADPELLVDQIVRTMRSPDASRELTADVEPVEPEVTAEALFDAQPVVVTVSRDATTVRVFERGKLVKSYGVAVGEPKYPTPTGTFTVQTKQVDPVWNVPNSDWAGELAGTTVPGGVPENPLKERWIGFNGAVGFHGTADIASLRSAASHGCVRMSPADVIDLYERVEIGTTIYVA